MKIITWNTAFTNKKIIESLDYILQKKPNILCMQEITKEGLHYLKNFSKYNLYQTGDGKNIKDKSKNLHLVTMVDKKYPILNCKVVNYYDKKVDTWWSRLMAKTYGYIDTHNAIIYDTKINNKEVRIINAHLIWAKGSIVRFVQINNLLSHCDKNKINIVCGDFNIINKWYIGLLVALPFSYSIKEIFVNEYKEFKKIFTKNNFVNVFEGENTWPWVGVKFQLDYILFNPKQLKLIRKKAPKQKVGSDHKMLILDVNVI